MTIEFGSLPAEVKFLHQKDPKMQALVDVGVGESLETSGYCWAACIDMALSPFIQDDNARHEVLLNSVNHESLANGVFNKKGELLEGGISNLVDAVNRNLRAINAVPRLMLLEDADLHDYHLELLKGRAVIFGTANDNGGGHVRLMDAVYQDGGKYYYEIYDPAEEDQLKARQHINNFELYGMHTFTNTHLRPFIISVGKI